MSPTWWGTTDRLGLTFAGVVYLLDHDPGDSLRRLGPIEDQVDVPPVLEAELAELVDRWSDAFDPAEESRAASSRALPSPSSCAALKPRAPSGRWTC